MDKKTEQKGRSDHKKKLIRTQNETRRFTYIITAAIILIVAVVYYFVDSRSYVASVAGNRITPYEYKFLLRQQVLKVEDEEGIGGKTNAERAQYWLSAEGGQTPWETAKNETLNAAKEYLIQLIKAREIGLSVDASIQSEVSQFLKTAKQDATDAEFEVYIKSMTGVTLDQYRKILENANLVGRFESEYIKRNYQPAALTDEELKAAYDKDTKQFDKVDISYVSLGKVDDKGTAYSEDVIKEKKAKADEALAKIKAGTDMDQVIKDYSEEKPSADQPNEPVGKATLSYSTGSNLQQIIDFAFTNEVGTSTIIDHEYGYYVVLITKRTGFEDVKSTVQNYMKELGKNDFYTKAIQSWTTDPKYNIIKNDVVYDGIQYESLFPVK